MDAGKVDPKIHRINTIIGIAHRLFEQKGYEAVGIREICHEAGLSPTQLYRLGLTKQDLLAEVILRVNQEQIDVIMPFSPTKAATVQKYIEDYLQKLYVSDIKIKSIRAEGAAFGWKWSDKYESLITKQVFQLLKPIADALEHGGYDDIHARCYLIWCLYYVGYRKAVMNNSSAQECIKEIKPSLMLCLSHK